MTTAQEAKYLLSDYKCAFCKHWSFSHTAIDTYNTVQEYCELWGLTVTARPNGCDYYKVKNEKTI